jgi:CubicO group peptidase (beta-lactamase class C family)
MPRKSSRKCQILAIGALVLAAISGAGNTARGQNIGGTAPGETSVGRQVDVLMRALAHPTAFSGTVLIARGDRILAERAYGYADLIQRIPNTVSTQYRIASVSKPITATAVMQLQDVGLLSVNDSVCLYMASCPNAWQSLTIRHLLSHTSGIPDYGNLPSYDSLRRRHASPAQILGRFRDLPLEFPPGQQYSYSNSNYTLLGIIVERVSGKPLEQYLRERIFSRVGMVNTASGRPANSRRAALGYRWDHGLKPVPLIDLSNTFAVGGIVSTAEDLFRFARAFQTGQILTAGSRKAMATPAKEDYGYGWMIGEQYGHHMLLHNGGFSGFRAVLQQFPDDSLVVVVLSNVEGTNTGVVAQYLSAIGLGMSYSLNDLPPVVDAPEPTPVTVRASVLAHYTGRYEAPMGLITVLARGDSLFTQSPESPEEVPLIAVSATRFIIRGPAGVVFTFVSTGGSTLPRLEVTVRGKVFPTRRLAP